MLIYWAKSSLKLQRHPTFAGTIFQNFCLLQTLILRHFDIQKPLLELILENFPLTDPPYWPCSFLKVQNGWKFKFNFKKEITLNFNEGQLFKIKFDNDITKK